MKYSNLLSTVRSGKWMILPSIAAGQKNIVEKLFDRSFTTEEFNAILSEKKKLQVSLAGSTALINADSSQFSEAPENSVAIFSISGTMVKYGTWCSYGTTEIAEAIKEAADSGNITGVVLDLDSGGGSVDSIAPLIAVIQYCQSLNIPVVACVDLCASACYYIACYCDEIIAGNDISSEIGSIGVMISFQDYTKYYAANGIENHIIYSNFSDWKNLPFMNAITGAPDDATKYDLLKTEELDPLAKKFQQAVVSQRPNLNQTVDGIIAGRMFFADQAKEYGLIDNVGDLDMAVKRCQDIRSNNIINKYLNQ